MIRIETNADNFTLELKFPGTHFITHQRNTPSLQICECLKILSISAHNDGRCSRLFRIDRRIRHNARHKTVHERPLSKEKE